MGLKWSFRKGNGLAARIEKLFTEAMENPQWHEDGAGACRAHAGLGLLFSKTRKNDDARRHLERAKELSHLLGARNIQVRVDRALAAMNN